MRKKIELYRGSVPCRVLKGGTLLSFTSEKADERVYAFPGAEHGLDRFSYSSGLTLPLPATDTPVLPRGAEAFDVLRAKYSSASRTRSVVPGLIRKSVPQKERNVLLRSMWERACGGL